MNQYLPIIMFLFISVTIKDFILLFFHQLHISVMQIHLNQLVHPLPIEEMYFDYLVLVFLLVSYIPLYEEVILKQQNLIQHDTFVCLCFLIHVFGLPASSILNLGISLPNLLSSLASTWFDCTSFPGSCFADLGSQSCL